MAMVYDISQTSHYLFDQPVAGGQQLLRLSPVSRGPLLVLSHVLDISPMPAERHSFTDYYGNACLFVRISQPHSELRIVSRSRVRVAANDLYLPIDLQGWAQVADAARAMPDLSPEAPAHMIGASRMVTPLSAIADYARPSFGPGRPVAEACLDLARRMQADFAYDPKATDIATPVADAFARRAGVCQDFAHIMIAGLRGIGLPARYVSGYLRTIPPPGAARLEGADATHAWVSVWTGVQGGWTEFDPTNGLQVGTDHIPMAIGRDYADVSPVDGVIRASGGQTLDVSVDVIPL